MTIVNCDRAAAFYDLMRAYPAGVTEQCRDAVLAYSQADG